MSRIVPLLAPLILGGALAGPTPRPAATPAARPTAVESRTVVGQIVSFDAPSGMLVVGESMQASAKKEPKGETLNVKLDAATLLVRGKRAATVEELKPKDHVVVRYVVTPGGARAVSVRVADLVTHTPLPGVAPVATSAGQN